MDRLLAFDLIGSFPQTAVHEPGRTLVLTDYLSRHPSEYNDSTIKSGEIFSSWFTINVVKETIPALNKKSTKENEPIRTEGCAKIRNYQKRVF